jgi:valyl-tRNA synthetase
VIDPLTIMDKYGTDAFRFTLAAMASPGRDIKLSEERIEGYRNFANKIWNAARFIQMNLDGPREAGTIDERSVVDQWLLSRLHRCIAEVNSSLDTYRFDEAANHLYHFIWHEYCDWYLELVKPALSDKQSPEAAATLAMLVDTFDTLLRLLHPFMPFITEELWQALPHTSVSIMLAPYPASNGTFINERVEQELESVQRLISGVRDIKGTQGIAPSKPVNVTVATASATIAQSLQKHEKLTRALIRVDHLNIGEGVQHPAHVASTTATLPGGSLIEIGIDLAGVLDVQKEKARVEKRLKDISSQMEETQKKLANSEFVAKVPREVLEKTRARHQECLLEHEKLSAELTRLGRLAGGAL